MSSVSIMPLYDSLNVALIQTPICKRVADPQKVWMSLSSSGTPTQAVELRMGVSRGCAPGWAGLGFCVLPVSSPLTALQKKS